MWNAPERLRSRATTLQPNVKIGDYENFLIARHEKRQETRRKMREDLSVTIIPKSDFEARVRGDLDHSDLNGSVSFWGTEWEREATESFDLKVDLKSESSRENEGESEDENEFKDCT